MSDLRPEHCACQAIPFTKSLERSGDALTFRNKTGPIEIGNWMFAVASFFPLSKFRATS